MEIVSSLGFKVCSVYGLGLLICFRSQKAPLIARFTSRQSCVSEHKAEQSEAREPRKGNIRIYLSSRMRSKATKY